MNTYNPFDPILKKLDQIQAELEELKSKPVPIPHTQEKFLTTEEVCTMLSISRVSLWHYDKKGITKPVRIGNLKRYKLSEIEGLGERS